MRRLFQTLQSRLILLIILVALPGLACLIYHSFVARKEAINASLQQAINVVNVTTENQAQLITKTQHFLQVLSTLKALSNLKSDECSTTLSNILKLNDSYINLGAPRADGELLCNASPLKKSVNVADRPYIQQALATRKFSIGKFQVDRAIGITSINFAYPVFHQNDNEVVGLVVAVVSLDWWSQRLAESHLPENTVAYITDREQNIIAAYPANSKLLGTNIYSVLGNILERSSSLGHASKTFKSADNHLRIFVSRPLAENGGLSDISITVGIPFDEQLSVINARLIKIVGFLFTFVVLMLIIATWGIRKSVLIPLKCLLHSTQNLELGKNVCNISQCGTSELVDLQQRFASMAKTRLFAEQELKNSQLSLLESEQKLSRHIENTPLGCISWDRNFICTEWNRAAENIFGYRSHEAIGRQASELILDTKHGDEINTFYALLLQQKSGKHLNESVTKNGCRIVCEWYNTPIIAPDGSLDGVTSLVQDVTERKQLEDKLTQAACVFSHAREGIIITDAVGIVIDVNATFVAITGYERNEVLGKKTRMLKSNRHSPLFYNHLWQTLSDKGYWHGEIWNKRKNHEIYPALFTISAVHDEAGEIQTYVALFTDITEIKIQQLHLQNMAHYDALTSLPNRLLLNDRLNQAITQSKRNKQSLAVALLDLDGFKTVNDEHGHQYGDELLVGLSHHMKEALRDGDTLSRFGGDEFVVILADLDKTQDFEPVIERLLEAASMPIMVSDTLLKVSASIGVTLYPLDNVDPEQLLRHADQAMYIAKQKGKNCYHLFDLE
ncbi:diguanylate cyclase domain-containing protein [Psychromonas antarctica]|uniref:diguanylate cyclase domain-containing protein n=1 Tax=Psychromonas antarctica TaxID=67573 RepID=UPI001EE928CF|nr:diguanylate cyclase [Psychromonas antarctica]MCG6202051.1 diguanylate cyclase [Psychromonas antarctica]